MTNRIKNLFIFFIVFTTFSIFTNCEKNNSFKSKSVIHQNDVVEDFDIFYEKFHNDSLFQMSRIKFPLKGVKVDSDGKLEWSKSNWATLKTKIFDIDTTQYKIEYKKTKHSFYQKFWIENSGFWSEYKFDVIDKKWFLVYAVDQSL
jgi:hypothetical protein